MQAESLDVMRLRSKWFRTFSGPCGQACPERYKSLLSRTQRLLAFEMFEWMKWANTRRPEVIPREWKQRGARCPMRTRWELLALLGVFVCRWIGCNPFHITGLRSWTDILKEDEPRWLFGRRFIYPRIFDVDPYPYAVVDHVRPIPEGLSEAMTIELFAPAQRWGNDRYFQYGRKRTEQSKNPDKTIAIGKAEKCMDRKRHYPLEYVPLTDSIPSRITVYYESAVPALVRSRIPNRAVVDGVLTEVGGTWAERKGESRTWKPDKKAKPAWVQAVWGRLKNGPETTKPLPAVFSETVMLPLPKRIVWKGKGQNAVKCVRV